MSALLKPLGSYEIGCVTFVLAKAQVGLMAMTSDNHRALVVVDNSAGVGIMYVEVFVSLWGVKPYETPTLASTYAIEAALSANAVVFVVMDMDANSDELPGSKEV